MLLFMFSTLKHSLELITCKPWILFNLFCTVSSNNSSNFFSSTVELTAHFFSAYSIDSEDLSSNCPGDSAADHD